MSEDKKMVDINLAGDFGKPLDTFIKKIANATGFFYKKWFSKQIAEAKAEEIKTLAKAEAEAKVIQAKADLEISDLQRRSLERFVQEETIKQQNMESIVDKAIPLLEEDFNPEEIEDDWIANFFDKCRIVSDDEMQTLWAKILAGEVNEPSTFSKITINVVSTLDRTDAEQFTKLCNFIAEFAGSRILFKISHRDRLFLDNEINYDTLFNLSNLGLINFSTFLSSNAVIKNLDFSETDQSYSFTVNYFDEQIVFKFNDLHEKILLTKSKPPEIRSGGCVLTKAGLEISRVCQSTPVDGYTDYVVEELKSQRMMVKSRIKLNQ